MIVDEFETWVDIQGFEGLYQVSTFGRIKGLDRIVYAGSGKYRTQYGRVLKPGVDTEGYLYVGLCKDGVVSNDKVHRLVCKAFHLNPENKPEVNHKDGIKNNNHKNNVEWNTRVENMNHSSKNGLVSWGERVPHSKITVEIVKLIRTSKLSGVEFSKQYGISEGIISDVRTRRTWKQVE